MAGSATGGRRAVPVQAPARGARLANPWSLIGVVVAGAVCGLAAYSIFALAQAPEGISAPHLGHLAFAVGMFTAAQLARIFHRVRGDAIMLAWGEVGVMAALCLAPAYWLPMVAAVGALLGHGPRLFRPDRSARVRVLFTTSVLTVGATASASVVALLADPRVPLRATPTDLGPLLPLGLAAAAYYLCTSVLSAVWAAVSTGTSVLIPWRSAARTKRVMLAVAVPMGGAIAFAAGIDPLLVAGVVPSLWLVHQAYAERVASAEERRVWNALAEATRSLHQLDEPAVALAALRGAVAIFAPTDAELSWQSLSGQTRRYRIRGSVHGGKTSGSVHGGMRGNVHGGKSGAVDDPSGSDSEDAAGAAHDLADHVPADDGAPAPHVVRRALLVGGAPRGEMVLRFRHSLPLRPVDQMAFATFADAVASALQDAASHRRLQELAARGAYEAIHDPLTGLSNRSSLLASGDALLRRSPPDQPVALVVFGLEGLHPVKETLGHGAGDDLLRLLAQRLAAERAPTELLGRTAEDEFALLVPNGDGDRGTADRAAAVAAVLAEPAKVGEVTVAVAPSAGVVDSTAGACDMAELLRRAEVALHQARRSGSRVVQYDGSTDAAAHQRLALLADLRDALATTDQFRLALQPAVNMVTGAPVSVEALARWQHPRRGLLMPGDFIPVVDHSDLATGLALHMVDLTLAMAARWAAVGITVPVSVNLCARCMVKPDLASLVADLLRRHAVPPGRLTLEMSESIVEGEEQQVHRVITALRELGVRVSVDDFGTGSASLSFLTRFHVDEVKIDRSFVATMVDSPETAAIVRTTVDLARGLGLRIIAEGVERAEQRDALLELGVTMAQGFLFHRSLTEVEATELLQAAIDDRA